MIERLFKVVWLLILLFFAARDWHIYIRQKQYEENGWFMLMAAFMATIASVYVCFMW